MAKYDFFITPDPEKTEKTKYIAKIVNDGDLDINEIARLTEHYTRTSRGAILLAWDSILTRVIEALKEGKRVHLDGLGYLSLAATSKVVDAPDEFRAESVHYKGVNFRPDKSCNRNLCITKFERTHVKHSSTTHPDEIRTFLREFFRSNEYITCRILSQKCKLSVTSAGRKMRELVAEGMLKHPGPRNSAFYFKGKKLEEQEQQTVELQP